LDQFGLQFPTFHLFIIRQRWKIFFKRINKSKKVNIISKGEASEIMSESNKGVENSSSVNMLNVDAEKGGIQHGRRASNMSLVNQSQIKIICQDLQFSVLQRKPKQGKRVPQGWCSRNQSQQKTIINGVTAAFKPGRLTAVMGASGAGKTSLLSLLAGIWNIIYAR
jgi:ABC-type uncharacterized transport system fused permease/ATPase subunit